MAALTSISRKTLLYKSGVQYADFALNHVEGCSHGCLYPCYAMMLKRRCGVVKTYEDWIRPKIVGNALELLDKEVRRLKDRIRQVFLCFTTDPFMYEMPEVSALTLEILKRLGAEQIKALTISKGIYPEVLIDAKTYGRQNEYGATIVSLSEDFRQTFEPGAAPIQRRIKALRVLHEAGLKTWVSIEPYPTPNIIEQDIREILEAVSFVDRIVFGRWNYSRQARELLYAPRFYNAMADEVTNFCRRRGIEVVVKEGTVTPGDMSLSRDRHSHCATG